MSRMTQEKTAGTEDQHELVGINSTVPLRVEHSDDLTEHAGGTAAPTGHRSAADIHVPLRIHPVRTNGWRKETGVSYLVALDVDGTLVDHDGHMSPAVREAARAVRAAGHHVVVSTGRSKGATLPVVELIGQESGYAVCSNGGMTLELDPALPEYHRVLECVSFDPGQALEALERRLPTAKFALETEDGSFYSTERFQDSSFGIEAVGVDLHELAGMKAVRMVVYSTEHTPEEFALAIDEAGLHGVTYSVGWSAWLDIAANGVSKASALEQVRRRLGVDPAHTIAIGDGRNDIEMLDWAARGVAMGQAPDEVVAVCHEVTHSVYDDGAATVLRTLL
ncbi:Cof-type HAD-IIB family hydrolase [Kocuria sp. LUK]|uniref:HAD family hydrolase n=1 Tax=Kocuria flava TaxID=446860 RepID=A0A2N4SYE9_9MICC|nr:MULTISPECIES: HAD family hydrolase [Kocuria]MCD1145945.1 Cof-type HAD-IIB family hydrolase [Kocuria sp. LUK]PLC11005.1 HAD family hydrolase [Kocuria flava]